MGTSHRQAPVRDLVGAVRDGPRRAVRASRRLRGRARQRRHDGLLGRRRRLARPRAGPPPDLWRVLAEVRQGDRRRALPRGPDPGRGRARRRSRADRRPRRRRDRLGPQRDLDRRHGRGPPPAGAGDALVLIDGTSGAGGPAPRPGRGRRLLLRPAEGLRRRRRALAGAAQPGGDRPDRGARRRRGTAGSRRSSRCRPRSRTRARTRPTTRRRWRPCCCSPTRSSGCSAERRARVVRRPHHGLLGAPLRLGRGGRLRVAVRRRPGEALARRRHDRLRRLASTPRRWPRRCGPTGSSTSSPTASSAATSCGSGCSRRSTPPTSRR